MHLTVYTELESILEICHLNHLYYLYVPREFHSPVCGAIDPNISGILRDNLVQGGTFGITFHLLGLKSCTYFVLQTGACVLSLGYANFIIIPCTNLFGRRPVALACAIIVIGSNIWPALATSYNSLLGARALIGIGSATSESLMPVTIADTLFLHERGTWMGVYL
jgi:MFS family permease